ncbi:MAG: TetR family transcriptional regulator [Xanthobacteraceae bacterium]
MGLDLAGDAVATQKRGSSRLPREERVGAIESAARVVFCRRGYAEASIAEIAAEAGIAEGTIYKFFDSKRQLVMRVIERWYESMLAEFAKNLPGIAGARNKVRFIVWRHLSSLKADLDVARLCLHEARNSRDYYQSELYQLNRRYTHFLIDACREGISNGEFREDAPVTLVRDMIFGGIDHHTWAMLFGHGDIDPDRSADLIMDIVFAGIEKPAAPAPSDNCSRVQKTVERLEALAERMEKMR